MSFHPEVPLGDVCRVDRDLVPVSPGATYRSAGIYSFGRGMIDRGEIRGEDTRYRQLTKLHAGQIVYARLNAWEGAIDIVPSDFDGSHVSNEYPTFSVDEEEVDLRYLRYLLHWPQLWERMTPRGSMIRRKRTTENVFLATPIPLPDLAEQRRIANRLDSSLARLDAAHLEIAHAAKLRDGMLGSFFFSHGWPTEPAGRLLVSVREPINIYQDTKYRATGIKSFGRGLIRYPPQRGSELSKLRYFIFPAHALAISNIKAWEGAVAVTGDDAADYVASNRFLFYVPSDRRVDVRFVRYYLLSREGLYQLNQASPGSADRNRTLSVKSFEQVKVPVPDLDVQRKVADALDSVTIRADPLEQRRTELLKAIKPSLLNAAFSGQM